MHKTEWVTPDEHNSREDDSRRACLKAMESPDERCLREEKHSGPCDRPAMFDTLRYRRDCRPLEAETHAGDEQCPSMSDLHPDIRCGLKRGHDGQHQRDAGGDRLARITWINHKHIQDVPETQEEKERFAKLEQLFEVVLKRRGFGGVPMVAKELAEAVFHKPDPPPPTLGQVAHDAFQKPEPYPWANVDPASKLRWEAAAVAAIEAAAERERDKPHRMIDVGDLLSEAYAVLTDSNMLFMFRVQNALILLNEAI